MLLAVCGALGSGKTMTLTFLGVWFQRKGYDIYANYKLTFPHTRINTLKDLTSFRNGVFLGDELWSWTDSREFGSKKNKEINAILLKSRKRGIDIFYTTQHFKQMDVRIRRITDIIIFPEIYKHGTRCKLHFYDGQGYRLRKPGSYKTQLIHPLYDTTEEVEDIQGFEGLQAIQLMREAKAVEKLKVLDKEKYNQLLKRASSGKKKKS